MREARRHLALALSAASALVVAGCRQHTDTWHCDAPARAACSQWTTPNPDPKLQSEERDQCRAMGGAPDDGPCTDELVIGSCIAPGPVEVRIVYYPPRTLDGARRACAAVGGRWY